MARGPVPKTIIGIGNGGKKVVYEMLDQDWILTEALEPRDDDGSPSINPVIIDSESGHKNSDPEKVSAVNERIKEKAQDLGHPNPNTEVTYINPAEDTRDDYTESISLTSAGPVNDIVRSADLRAWWLEAGADMLADNSDYSEGVERRRALSKALYHGSQADGDPIAEVVDDAAADDHAYIVVGIGGGTGSGMFIDLAKRLNERDVTVHLMGILPNESPGQQEEANTYAALSELEYLSLTDQNPFRNIVLFPFAEARKNAHFDEGMVNAILSHYALTGVADGIDNETQHFDPGQDGSNVTSKFAPFTVAAPKIFHYDAPEVQEAERKISEYIGALNDALDTEDELYEQFAQTLYDPEGVFDLRYSGVDAAAREPPTPEVPDGVGEAGNALENSEQYLGVDENRFELDSNEAQQLEGRIERVKRILDADIFDQLEYVGPRTLKEEIENMEQNLQQNLNTLEEPLEEADPSEYIGRYLDALGQNLIDFDVRTQLDGPDGPVDDLDVELTDALRRELVLTSRRANVLRALHLVEDRGLKDALKAAPSQEVSRFAQATAASQSRQSLKKEGDELERKVELLAQAADNAETELEHALTNFSTEVEPDVDRIVEIDQSSERIEALISDLRNSIYQAIDDLNSSGDEKPPENPLHFSAFAELNNLLKSVGADEIPARRIENSMSALSQMKRAKLDEGGLIDLPWGDDPQDSFENAERDVDPELFHVEPDFEKEFSCTFKQEELLDERLEQLKELRETRINRILETLDEYTQNVVSLEGLLEDPVDAGDLSLQSSLGLSSHNTEYREKLRRNLKGNTFEEHSVSEVLERLTSDESATTPRGIDNVVYAAMYEAIVDPVVSEFEEQADQFAAVKGKQLLIDRAKDLTDDEGQQYVNNPSRNVELDVDFETYIDENYVFKESIAPEQRGRFVGAEDLSQVDLMHLPREPDILLSKIKEQAGNIGPRLAPIQKGTIQRKGARTEGDRGSVYYDETVVKTVLMSRIFDGDDPTPAENRSHYPAEIKETLGIRFEDDEEHYNEFKLKYAAPWDLVMTTFIGGVFLDNISSVGEVSGYAKAYKAQREEKEENIRIRHTHGIDGKDAERELEPGVGMYVIREELCEMESADRNMFTDDNETEIAEQLLDMYTISTFDSPFELDYD